MTDRDDTLVSLAAACGFAESYHDQRGTLVHPPESTLRRLLASMGVIDSPEADRAALETALRRERSARWRGALAPVRVLREGDGPGIEIAVAEAHLDRPWRWRLALEDGGALDGEVVPRALPMAGADDEARGELDGTRFELHWLALPALGLGYHELTVEPPAEGIPGLRSRLIVAPARCHEGVEGAGDDGVGVGGRGGQGGPGGGGNGALPGPRVWGPALQLYAVRSKRNQGIGDFTDLADACRLAARLGGDLVGINPLHALFAHDPEQASPYSPSSRLFLHPMYIDLEAVPGYAGLDEDERPDAVRLAALRTTDFVEYAATSALKSAALEALHRRFVAAGETTDEARNFAAWRRKAGEALERFALFETLREANAADPDRDTSAWWDWPEGWRTPDGDGARRMASERADRVDYHAWLQWLAAVQLEGAAVAGREAGLAVGLYRDLAVGTAGGGSDAWAAQDAYLRDVHVGAPPDDFSAHGQDWGLPPLDPRALAREGFEPFAEMLRANMRAAGAIRIDHVMGLSRLFWIPEGESPAVGAYVAYPLDDMLAVLALESRRARCTVVGEDLGTVQDGFREALADAGVLSYKLMYFEKDYEGDQGFRAPSEYPYRSLVGADTHDLPTLRGFWKGDDLAVRQALDLFPDEAMLVEQRREREADKRRLLEALGREGLLPAGVDPADAGSVEMDEGLVAAVHGFLARTDSMLLVANVEDLVGQVEQMNLPGTDYDLYPNWRRRLDVALDELEAHAGVRAAAAAMNAGRALR